MDETETVLMQAQIMVLKQLFASMLARQSAGYADPEAFIMAMVAPAFEGANAFDRPDEGSRAVSNALTGFAQEIEDAALALARS